MYRIRIQSILISLGLVLLALSLVSCGGSSGTTVTQDQDGGSVELKTGAMLEVRLASNITTGFSWQLLDLQSGVLVQQGAAVYEENKPGSSLGAGGVDIFRFKAAQPGEIVLKLVYRRLWETDVEPEDTFELLVVVK